MVEPIRRVARWVVLFAALSLAAPQPHSDPKAQMGPAHIPMRIIMCLLAMDMLVLICQLPRPRVYITLEVVLYTVFIVFMLSSLLASGWVSAVIGSDEMELGARIEMLVRFGAIYATLLAAGVVVLLDARQAYRRKS